MSEVSYNDQGIADYLLGSLPSAEAERYDELSVSDDEFAAALNAGEKDLVDAYVHGELAEPALERFKSHYLASRLRHEKVVFAQAFQVFAERDAANVRINDASDTAPKRGWFAALSKFLGPKPLLQWGLAVAILVLLFAGGWFVFQNAHLRQETSQAQARRDELMQHERQLQRELDGQREANAVTERELASLRAERERLEQELKQAQGTGSEQSVVSLALAPPLRGAEQIRSISIAPETKRVAVVLQLEAADYPVYAVALIDRSSSRNLWHSGALKSIRKGERNTVAVSFPATLLKTQTYSLRVSGVPAGGQSEIISDYTFKVVKQ
jgi:hypothetical protein